MGARSKLVVFDFETGGLSPLSNPVMEIGLVTLDQLTLQEEIQWESLIKPYKNQNGGMLVYEKKALETHGIDPARCEREGRSTEEVVKQLIALFKQVRPARDGFGLNRPILCGHNVMFDVAFLAYIFQLHGHNIHDHILSNNGHAIVWDTQQMAGMLWNTKGEGQYNLGACCERAGLGNFLAHSALSDARSTAELLRYLITAFREGKPDEVKASERPKSTRRARISSDHKVKFQF